MTETVLFLHCMVILLLIVIIGCGVPFLFFLIFNFHRSKLRGYHFLLSGQFLL